MKFYSETPVEKTLLTKLLIYVQDEEGHQSRVEQKGTIVQVWEVRETPRRKN